MKKSQRIYFSKLMDADVWHEGRIYWFPYAEQFCRLRYGWPIMKHYIALRMWLDGKLK